MAVNHLPDGTLEVVPHRHETAEILRDLLCRVCGARIDHDATTGVWRHEDGTAACLDPDTMRPYPDSAPPLPGAPAVLAPAPPAPVRPDRTFQAWRAAQQEPTP